MRIEQRAAAYGLAALALAFGVIVSGTVSGILPLASPFLNPGSMGTLSIALTDPPVVPDGVTAIYVSYSGIGVHLSRLGPSGWLSAGSNGTLETMSLVNVSQTMLTSEFPGGKYDMISLNVSAAQVTFNGKTYPASVNGGNLLIPVSGDIELNATRPAAVVVDLRPVVLNVGNQTSPSFILTAGANAIQMPKHSLPASIAQPGSRFSLSGQPWFKRFALKSLNSVTIGGVDLTASSLAFTLTSNSSDQTGVRMIFLTPVSGPSSGKIPILLNWGVFVVKPNATMNLLAASHGKVLTPAQLRQALAGAGYRLAPGKSTNFDYSGLILTLRRSGVVTGTQYTLTVVTYNSVTTKIVMAS